jgi:TolB-like protein/predicted Ser/Thr protein kinase
MALEPGTRLGPYEIVELRGKGGMGEVYRARDTRLDRDVAVKVLPAELTEDETYRKRLEREAKTISQLQHDRVCRLYDVGTEGEVQFLVMEYLEGETLDERLLRDPPGVEELARIGCEVADAIYAAHEAGVVHRDLKPANIMLTGSGVKVLDFGLARESPVVGTDVDTRAATVPEITVAGQLAGTMHYMAPEQLRGELAGPPADMWALGCTLYQMATGRRPFEGASQADLIASIVDSQPDAPSSRNPQCPVPLERVITRCLEKNPERRWHSARDVAIELETIAGGRVASATPAPQPPASPGRGRRPFSPLAASAVAIAALLAALLYLFGRDTTTVALPLTSIAVLPFEDLTAGGDQQRLGRAVANDLSDLLSRSESLQVAATASATRARTEEVALSYLGGFLQVGSIVDGQILEAGDDLRLSVQLIRLEDGYQIWSGTYEGPADALSRLQEEIAVALYSELGVEHRYPWLRRARFRTRDPRAFELLIKAVESEQMHTEEGYRGEIEYALQALEIDPGFAQAHAQKAWAHYFLWFNGFDRSQSNLEMSRESAENAIAIDEWHGSAQMLLAIFSMDEWDWEAAEERIYAAITENPGQTDLRFASSRLLLQTGRVEESLVEIRLFVGDGPSDTKSWALVAKGEIEEGRALLERSDLDFPSHRRSRAGAQFLAGDHRAALSSILEDAPTETSETVLASYDRDGLRPGLQGALGWLNEDFERPCHEAPIAAVRLYAWLEDREGFFECMDAAIEERALLYYKTDPTFDAFRDDPRFKEALRRMNLLD